MIVSPKQKSLISLVYLIPLKETQEPYFPFSQKQHHAQTNSPLTGTSQISVTPQQHVLYLKLRISINYLNLPLDFLKKTSASSNWSKTQLLEQEHKPHFIRHYTPVLQQLH